MMPVTLIAVSLALVVSLGSADLSPVPSSLNIIGFWLREDPEVSDRQRWVDAYACALQRVAEAAQGRWTSEGQTLTPEVTELVEAFMAVTGTRVLPCRIWECWLLPLE